MTSSIQHETPLELFRETPEFAVFLLRELLGIELPPHDAVETASLAVPRAVPSEYHADLVVILRRQRVAVAVVILEVQRGIDDDKPFRWPLYAASAHSTHRVTTLLVVLALNDAVAQWAGRAVATFQPPSPFRPIVLDPGRVPIVTDVAEAAGAPELAVLSALMHGDRNPSVALAALYGSGALPPDRGMLYADLILAVLGDAARAVVEVAMQIDGKDYQLRSETLKKLYARGVAEGREEGREEGELHALREAVHAVLSGRGLSLEPAHEQRLADERRAEVLRRYLERAVSAASVDEVFA